MATLCHVAPSMELVSCESLHRATQREQQLRRHQHHTVCFLDGKHFEPRPYPDGTIVEALSPSDRPTGMSMVLTCGYLGSSIAVSVAQVVFESRVRALL